MTRYSNNPTEIDWDQYTTNQHDLRKAWESEGSGESAAVWGKRHYNTSGKAEGRPTDWISDDEGADWEGYTKSNEDLNAHWQSLGGDQTAAEFGESHWYNHGKKEGRTLTQQQLTKEQPLYPVVQQESTKQQKAQDFKDKKVEEVKNNIDWNQYTTNQHDLRKAWESEGSGESAAVWGKRHYNTSGKAEGRPTDWISDDEGADWEGYTKSNKDLNDHWQSLGGDQTAAEFGESHWYNHGKKEGRTLTQQQKAQDFKDKKVEEVKNNIDWNQYTTNQYDLRKAWESEGSGESAADWGKRHYNTFGKADGRQTDWISDDEGADWEGYTKSHKDLNDHWRSLGGDQTAAEFGESHWYNHGKGEGRTLNQSPPDLRIEYDGEADQKAWIAAGGGPSPWIMPKNYPGGVVPNQRPDRGLEKSERLWPKGYSPRPNSTPGVFQDSYQWINNQTGEVWKHTPGKRGDFQPGYKVAPNDGRMEWAEDPRLQEWTKTPVKGVGSWPQSDLLRAQALAEDRARAKEEHDFQALQALYNRGEENPNTFANRGESVRNSERDAIRNRDGRISMDFPWQGLKRREGSGGNYEMPKQETSYKYQEYLNNFDPSPNSNKENTNSNNIHNRLKEMQARVTGKYGFIRPDESFWSRPSDWRSGGLSE